MPEEEVQVAVAGGAGSKNNIIKYLIIAIVFVLLIGMIFAISYYVSSLVNKISTNEKLLTSDSDEVTYKTLGTYAFDEFLVASKDLGVIKVEMGVELSADDMQEELTKRLGEMRNLIIRILSSKEAEEANRLASTNELQDEIRDKLNDLLAKYFVPSGIFSGGGPKKVIRVNFKDFYVKK